MNDLFRSILLAAINKDKTLRSDKDFDLEYVYIKHQDESEFRIRYAKIEKQKIGKGKNGIAVIVVYAEHNTPHVFAEQDLDIVEVKPDGKEKYRLKLQK